MSHDHHHHGRDHPHEDGHGHAHDHGKGLGDSALLWAVVINLALTAAQIAGGLAAGSVALVADGVHNLSDALALVLAFGARKLAARPATPAMSFGWSRAEIVAAFVNYLALIAVSVWLMVEAVGRLTDPPPVAGGLVMALAALALVVDLGTAWLTARLAKESVNIRAAWLHNLADAAVSVAVLIGGALILAFVWLLPVAAQATTLSGRVVTSSGLPIEQAKVEAVMPRPSTVKHRMFDCPAVGSTARPSPLNSCERASSWPRMLNSPEATSATPIDLPANCGLAVRVSANVSRRK